MSSKIFSNSDSRASASIEDICVSEEISDNEEILFELDECLHSKAATLNYLKEQVTNLETDIKKHTAPYNTQESSFNADVDMFRTVASKYVKKELIDFYIDRMRKSSTRAGNQQESTISALCQTISKEEDAVKK